MTKKTLQELKDFLKQYRKELVKKNLADFGSGITTQPHVRRALSMMNEQAGYMPEYIPVDSLTGYDLMKPLKKKFDNGLCMDLLEHVDNPFTVAENIGKSIKKGGLLFVTAPFSWEYHEVPVDYWRFTHTGILRLFQGQMNYIGIRMERDDTGEQEGEIKRHRIVAVFRKK